MICDLRLMRKSSFVTQLLQSIDRLGRGEGADGKICVSSAHLWLNSNIEFKQHHIPVLHDVFLPFHPVEALFPRGGDGAALD